MSVKAQDVTLKSGVTVKVTNQKRKPAANAEYTAILMIVDSKKVVGLITANELARIIKRAEKNPEDCPKESFWNGIL